MSQVISCYRSYTPSELHDLLMEQVNVGDPDELHNACIALCKLIRFQDGQIKAMQSRLDKLEKSEKANSVVAFRLSCYENGMTPD